MDQETTVLQQRGGYVLGGGIVGFVVLVWRVWTDGDSVRALQVAKTAG